MVLALAVIPTEERAIGTDSSVGDYFPRLAVLEFDEFETHLVLQRASCRATIFLVRLHSLFVPVVVAEEAERSLADMAFLLRVHGFVDHDGATTADLNIDILAELICFAVGGGKGSDRWMGNDGFNRTALLTDGAAKTEGIGHECGEEACFAHPHTASLDARDLSAGAFVTAHERTLTDFMRRCSKANTQLRAQELP